MKTFSASKTREADNYTIEHEPISSIDLMERASALCTKKIFKIYPKINEVVVFAGPGNNGGDGLAIARLLASKNINVSVYILQFTQNFSEDFKINLERLKKQNKAKIISINNVENIENISSEAIIIDAIFGSGLSRIAKGFPKEVIEKINNINSEIIAIDIPSGLFGEENNDKEKNVIKANHTITFQYPFLSFFFPENEKFIGKFHIIDIGIHKDFIKNTESQFFFTEKKDITIKKRAKFSHKGTYGHAIIFAGSYGMGGASVLAAKSAQRTGTGLVTAVVPKCNYEIMQISSPETILHIDKSKKHLSQLPNLEKYNALAIGPGIGFKDATIELLKNIIQTYKQPIVFDADAITILSHNKDWLNYIPQNSIFTPHPKEFEKLVGKSNNDFERLQMQINFAKKYSVIVLLKGANSSIATACGKVYFNSTGNPGMATAGSGDVLTGIIVSLLAQGYSAINATITAVYLHGLAGDIAAKKIGEYSLIASDIIDNLSYAFVDLEFETGN